jgi:hypothetical protein
MLEFLWVADEAEALSPQTRRTRLWERCMLQTAGVSPFGIVFASSGGGGGGAQAPYPTWSYHPDYLPKDLAIEIAQDTTLQEPELFYLPFVNRATNRPGGPTGHTRPVGRISGIAAGVPDIAALSAASRAAQQAGLLRYFAAAEHVLEMVLENAGLRLDLRPQLPLVFRAET